jgi:hypothetical protein
MLEALRNDVRKNRDLQDRMQVETDEKIRKLQITEQMLLKPNISQEEFEQLENAVMLLTKNMKLLEDKLANQVKPPEDKLAIYKQ